MMRRIDWETLGQRHALLAALPENARRASRLAILEPGQSLFLRGDAPAAMHFILAGEIGLVRRSLSGSELVMQRTTSGFVAEASLDQDAYHCDAIARAVTQALAIPRRAIRDALGDERFRTHWIADMARELRRVRAHCERLGLRTARERIIHFIEMEGAEGKLLLRQSRKMWATELGLTHEALYRAISLMVRNKELSVTEDGSVRLELLAQTGTA